jgi:uncharacterized protein YhfF
VNALPPFELGYAGTELRRSLVELVLAGTKTATSAPLTEYERDGEPVPSAGDRFALVDIDDRPVATVEVTESRVLPASEIDGEFATDEGEGFASVADWHAAHESFFGTAIEPGEPIVALRFRLVADGE